MNRLKFSRQQISIKKIGVFKFWSGIFVGLSASVILSLFFNYGRESLRIFTSLRADLLIISDSAFQFYDYFFASFATTLGLCLCIAIWFMGNKNLSRRKQLIQRLSLTYALLIFGMTILFIVRLGSLFSFLPLGLTGYDDHLNLIKETGFIVFLIPVNIFLIAWFQTRLVYKTGRWILYSFPICILIIVSVAKVTAVDRSLVNNKFYYELYETEFEYIGQEIQKAEELYNVEYSKETLQTLEKWHTESSFELLSDLKRSFESDRVVTMDSIILAKITVHTLKIDGKPDFNYQEIKYHWDYPSPSSILQQMKKIESASLEFNELVNLFSEEIKLINSHIISFEDSLELYDHIDFQRSAFLRNHLTKNVYNEADSIRKLILTSTDLSVPDSLFPALHQDYRRPTFEDQ